MPSLTHVCIRDSNNGWRRITAEQAGEEYSNTVSVSKHLFICELCGQYVTLTAEGKKKVQHFRHSRGEQDKVCAERTEQYNKYPEFQYGCYDMPLKLLLNNGTFTLAIGVPQGALLRTDFTLTVSGKITHTFNMKERVQESGITWLPLQQDIALKYDIKAIDVKFDTWPTIIPGINPYGTVFDGRGNKILHQEDEVKVGEDYYLITTQYADDGCRDISIKDLMHKSVNGELWRVYRVRATKFSPESARFFLQYKLRLVKKAIDLHVIWPMTVEEGTITYHNAEKLYLAYHGDEKVELTLMPYTSSTEVQEYGNYFRVQSNGLQQLAGYKWRDGLMNKSNHLMVWKRPFARTANTPVVEVFDKNNSLLEKDAYSQLPPKKQIIVSARYDGTITVKCRERTKQVITIKGGERVSLAIAIGDTVVVTQGCDVVREIAFRKPEKISDGFSGELYHALKRPDATCVSVSHRFGSCSEVLPNDAVIKGKIAAYIRQGKMPKNVHALIVKQLQNQK